MNAFGGSSSNAARAKLAHNEQDEKIMAMLEEEGAKRRAAEEAKAAEKLKVDVEGIAKEWATKEYTLRMLNGDIDDSLSEKDFLGKRAAYDDGEGGNASKKQRTGQGDGGDNDDAPSIPPMRQSTHFPIFRQGFARIGQLQATTPKVQNETSVSAGVGGGMGTTARADCPPAAWNASESGDAAAATSSLSAAVARASMSTIPQLAQGERSCANPQLLCLQQRPRTLKHTMIWASKQLVGTSRELPSAPPLPCLR